MRDFWEGHEMKDSEYVAQLAAALPTMATLEDCYNAGFDCGEHGPNRTNCHFAFFGSREKTAEWERGKAAAQRRTP